MTSWDRLTHFCRACFVPVLFSLVIAVVIFLSVLRWVDEQRTDRFQNRLGEVEHTLRNEQSRRTAEMAATRVLVLALVSNPPPPDKIEVIEVDVKRATEPYGLSPVIADLLHELRARSEANRKQATRDMRPRAAPAEPGKSR